MAVWQLEPSPEPLLSEVLPCFGTQLQMLLLTLPDYSLSPGTEEHSVLIF